MCSCRIHLSLIDWEADARYWLRYHCPCGFTCDDLMIAQVLNIATLSIMLIRAALAFDSCSLFFPSTVNRCSKNSFTFFPVWFKTELTWSYVVTGCCKRIHFNVKDGGQNVQSSFCANMSSVVQLELTWSVSSLRRVKWASSKVKDFSVKLCRMASADDVWIGQDHCSSGSQTFSRQAPLNWHKLDQGPKFDKILSQGPRSDSF